MSQCTRRQGRGPGGLAAVGQNGDFAPDELKADKEVALAAVGEYGEALRCTLDELRGGGLAAFVQEQVKVKRREGAEQGDQEEKSCAT